MPKGINLSSDINMRIIQLYESGVRQADISSRLELNRSVVSRT